MPLSEFETGDRVKVKKTGQTGTVAEVRAHVPGGRGGYYSVDVMVRVDGEADARPFGEPELESLA